MKIPKQKNKSKKLRKIKEASSRIKKIKELETPKKNLKLEEEIKEGQFQESFSTEEFKPSKLQAAEIEIDETREFQAKTETEEAPSRARYQTARELPYTSRLQSEIRPGAYAMRQDDEEREYSHAEELQPQLREANQRIFRPVESRIEPLQQDILARDELEAERQYEDRERQYRLKKRRE